MSDLFKIKSNAKVPANFIGSKVHGPLTDKEGNITKSVSDENRLKMSKRYVNSAFYVMYIETSWADQCAVIEDGEYNLIAVIPFGPEHDKKLEEFQKNYRGPKDTDE